MLSDFGVWAEVGSEGGWVWIVYFCCFDQYEDGRGWDLMFVWCGAFVRKAKAGLELFCLGYYRVMKHLARMGSWHGPQDESIQARIRAVGWKIDRYPAGKSEFGTGRLFTVQDCLVRGGLFCYCERAEDDGLEMDSESEA